MTGKKKTLFISLLIFSLAIFSGACGSDENGDSENQSTTNQSTTNQNTTNQNTTNQNTTNQNTTNQNTTNQNTTNQNNGDFSTGLDKDKKASEFTETDIDQFCEAVDTYALGLLDIDAICNGSGVIEAVVDDLLSEGTASAAELQSACATSRDTCIDDLNTSQPGQEESCLQDIAECEATVAQLETCFQAQTSQLADAFGSLVQCDELTPENAVAQLDAVESVNELPPECEIVDELCPGFFDDDIE